MGWEWKRGERKGLNGSKKGREERIGEGKKEVKVWREGPAAGVSCSKVLGGIGLSKIIWYHDKLGVQCFMYVKSPPPLYRLRV